MRGRLGMAYDVNRMHDVAKATYRQAEALDPEDFRWPYFRAHLIAEAALHAEALEVLDKAHSPSIPNTPPAWLWRGSWLLKAWKPGRRDGRILPRRGTRQRAEEAQFGHAQAMIALGRHDEAVEVLQSLVNTFPRPFVYRTLGDDPARPRSDRGSTRRHGPGRRRAARGLDRRDRRGQRTVHLRGNASYDLAKSLSAAGRLDDAVAILDAAAAASPRSPLRA